MSANNSSPADTIKGWQDRAWHPIQSAYTTLLDSLLADPGSYCTHTDAAERKTCSTWLSALVVSALVQQQRPQGPHHPNPPHSHVHTHAVPSSGPAKANPPPACAALPFPRAGRLAAHMGIAAAERALATLGTEPWQGAREPNFHWACHPAVRIGAALEEARGRRGPVLGEAEVERVRGQARKAGLYLGIT
jgi:hypothetical protein